MFPTQSHLGKVPEGPRLIRKIREVVSDSQALVAIGGINKQNLGTVFKYGADGVAVISSISASPNPRDTAANLIEISKQQWKAANCV